MSSVTINVLLQQNAAVCNKRQVGGYGSVVVPAKRTKHTCFCVDADAYENRYEAETDALGENVVRM